MRSTSVSLAIGILLTALHGIAAWGQGADDSSFKEVSDSQASLYGQHLTVSAIDGRSIDLSELQGAPVLITMFFASCPGVCPMMIQQMQMLESRLPAKSRDRLRTVIVSFDQGDTLERLRLYAKRHSIDPHRWIVAKATPVVAEALGDFLGIRFRKISSGVYSHDANLVILNAKGQIVASVPTASVDDPGLPALLRMLIDQADAGNSVERSTR